MTLYVLAYMVEAAGTAPASRTLTLHDSAPSSVANNETLGQDKPPDLMNGARGLAPVTLVGTARTQQEPDENNPQDHQK
jgi:hypothetical protein